MQVGLQSYVDADGYPEEYIDEEEEKLVTKVWILMGGDGLQRQDSIRSGLHAWLMLQNNPELQVCLPLPLLWVALCCAVLCCAVLCCAVVCVTGCGKDVVGQGVTCSDMPVA